ncbi:SagB/ThcOx family dehydrogenase [Leptolyngbya cf. ectocarpi LEGE 11479]|uniref:SagB/ThcOx family dehydrogenase n=1 Tax=Leptolyngbya cf. ectocarpi LEGE 11479 TaxID=1828722 RepID=A0A928ZU14_LEPEC|nr:SagB/ThcOx family dehydrogenase [Leptolyngbya ectocarpi]MBE9067429.1 SagB/ThcOx family dehydrogenase [Leptolyngbya cf. ectocarpi LEGE 11479]
MTEASRSLAHEYHQRTKYFPDALPQGSLNWAEQPEVYKTYPLGSRFDLQGYLGPVEKTVDQWWQRLSQFLFHSYGLTAKFTSTAGDTVYLRSAPSAGALYPAEIYLISRGTSQLPAGLYNYQVKTHSLVRFWDNHPWQRLQEACFWHPALEHTHLAVVTSVVFQRSVWRYQARAYRRVCLDTGHLLGNIELAASLCDYRPHLIGGFVDDAVNDLLYLPQDQESAIAILALADLLQVEQNLSRGCTALPSDPQPTTDAVLEDDCLLGALHQASKIMPQPDKSLEQAQLDHPPQIPGSHADTKYAFPFGNHASTVVTPIAWGEGLEHLTKAMLYRRSTRRYRGAAISLDPLRQLLDFTYHPEQYRDQGFDAQPDYFDLSLIQTFIVVLGVNNLDTGCYYYDPVANTLRQVRFKHFRRELHHLCLQQHLGRDASVAIIHTANLKTAIERHCDRAYRYLHMDAGHLGQRLNLAATRLGLGVSGIAGFFDDQVNDVLGIPEDEAVLYITTVGVP